MKISFLDSATLGEDVSLAFIKELGQFSMYQFTSPSEVNERIKDCDVIIVNKVIIGKKEMDAAPHLKLICVAATGVNNIDVDYAASKGIIVRNAVAYSTESVAQVTFMHILSLVGHGAYFDRFVKTGAYSHSRTFADLTHPYNEVKGKKLGIIGLGTIGSRVAEIAEVFGMHPVYFPTSGKPHSNKYVALSLAELLSECDIITIHAPLNDKTRNLITYSQLKQMKKTAYLLNMGRGGIVNEHDLVKALNEDLIAGAAIDVFEEEPIAEESPYFFIRKPEKIIFSPHIAWASVEARKRLIEKITEAIKDYEKQN
ncbi:MAG: D-2-hydroxyacid dehydrogenase [Culturomica sp.]|nr:D-2-hydroxyacid dehydrogenase [Culturomica sp.]